MSKRIQKVFDQTHELLSNIAQIRIQKEMVEMVAKCGEKEQALVYQ
jgi:hypothetical protein